MYTQMLVLFIISEFNKNYVWHYIRYINILSLGTWSIQSPNKVAKPHIYCK